VLGGPGLQLVCGTMRGGAVDDPKDGLPKDELEDNPEGKKPAGDSSLAPTPSAGGVETLLPAEPPGPDHAVEVPAVLTEKPSDSVRAAFEHPWVVRFCHWLNAVSVFVLVTSGLRIFRAFPSFGPKLPQKNLVDVPKALTLGGWLGSWADSIWRGYGTSRRCADFWRSSPAT